MPLSEPKATESTASRGLWLALVAAILGWMFDGFEMGLFPLAARPALKELLGATLSPAEIEQSVGKWIGVLAAGFLVGASTGGVLFGWMGDRWGRVRAMALSVLTYAVFSGLCGIANAPWQLFLFRFVASLGMGGEWSLGVSLVMELSPGRSRAWLAGLIGAASNVGFILIAILSLLLTQLIDQVIRLLTSLGLSSALVESLTANSAWRLLMVSGVAPAVLTFFIRLFVPESKRWQDEQARGTTRQWSAADLLAVLGGTLAALAIIAVWALDFPLQLTTPVRFSIENPLPLRIVVTAAGLVLAYRGYTEPVRRFMQRTAAADPARTDEWTSPRVLRRMLIGAALSGVALLGTWASLQNAAPWASQLAERQAQAEGVTDATAFKAASARASAVTQISAGIGAVIGTIGAALLGGWLGRRISYLLLCIGSLASSLLFFGPERSYGPGFIAMALLTGGLTASFYGWLPLYLPELFPTRMRAFGQGFAFNFGRIIAAVGSLQFAYLMKNTFDGSYPGACRVLSYVYVIGMVLIWLAPETHRQPLPE